jgi:hypothetical protein
MSQDEHSQEKTVQEEQRKKPATSPEKTQQEEREESVTSQIENDRAEVVGVGEGSGGEGRGIERGVRRYPPSQHERDKKWEEEQGEL